MKSINITKKEDGTRVVETIIIEELCPKKLSAKVNRLIAIKEDLENKLKEVNEEIDAFKITASEEDIPECSKIVGID